MVKRGRRTSWTEAERRVLLEQRANGATLSQLAVPGRTQKACVQEYYRLTKPETRPAARRRMRDASVIAPSPAIAASLAAPVKRPRYFHDIDMQIVARIARQGITAGFFGDPPPGRSALDQRQRQP